MIKVGVTGGIGSGKSVVCQIFRVLRIPVFMADEAGRKILTENVHVKTMIREKLGSAVFDTSGNLDRAKVAELVFRDKASLETLNAIVHPAVKAHFLQWMNGQKEAAYIIKEAAILFESGTAKDLDFIITVTAPNDLRISRVMQRDHVSRKNVEHRMKNQLSDEEKIKRAHFVICNDERELLIPQVISIHNELLKKSV